MRTEARKTQLLINQTKRDLKEAGVSSPQELIEGLDINALMEQFGVDPGILKSPLVRGLVDRYAPKLIEQITKQQNKGGGSVGGFQ